MTQKRRYLDVEEIKNLLSLPWENLNKELIDMHKEDMKSIIAFASGVYQAYH